MPKGLKRHICLALFMGTVSACATSPLYENDSAAGGGTVPRDEMGEPIWSKVEKKPAQDR
ncbi:MAG: hypothetical protein ACFBZ9_07590 [Sphingomonadales bacterium]